MGAEPLAFLLLLFALAALLPACARAEAPVSADNLPPAALHEQVLHLPGDPRRPADLQVTLYMPDGPGPFPLAVMLHGSDGRPRDQARYRFTYSAGYFLSRGYAVALPMMRGFAGSGGEFVDLGCDYTGIAQANARDIAAVIGDLASEPMIDARRVVVGGQSFGGWNGLALATMPPASVRGLIDFSGGMKLSICPASRSPAALVAGARVFGGQARIPTLWFYGDNDILFSKATWQDMVDAYRDGAPGTVFDDVGSLRDNSHQMLSYPEALPIWTPVADAFLRRIGLPAEETYPAYLPIPRPPPSGFADAQDAAAVPGQSDIGRAAYRQFLTRPLPRAFVLAADGVSAVSFGGFDPLARALAACRNTGRICRPYAIDNDVVWRKPPALSASGYADVGDLTRIPYLTPNGLEMYRRFLAWAPPRAFVLARNGFSASRGGADPLSQALQGCRARYTDCAPYAVDNVVVWRPAE